MLFSKPITINKAWQELLVTFKQWLIALGYAEKTVYGIPQCTAEALRFFSKLGVHHVSDIKNIHFKQYYSYLKTRKNKRTGGLLNPNTLNKQIQALQKFSEFLFLNHYNTESIFKAKRENSINSNAEILSVDEIHQLFYASKPKSNKKLDLALHLRNKALLGVFYSCGLRRNEGYHLDIDHFIFEKNLVHVKFGKGKQERLVPYPDAIKQLFLDYIEIARPILCKNKRQPAFFVNYRSRRLNKQSFINNLHDMIEQCNVPSVLAKNIGIHSLRHSIASHLLQNGLDLRKVARFLGHRSIESTQIYTHLYKDQFELTL